MIYRTLGSTGKEISAIGLGRSHIGKQRVVEKQDTGDLESRTECHRIVCWSRLAEFAGSLKSGAHIQVEGELRGREYQKDGVTHRIWECKASRICEA